MSEAQFYTHTIRAGSIKENDEQRTRSSFITDNLWRVTGIGLVVVLWQIGVMTDWINPF